MESIIRPFASREITPPKRVVTAYATNNSEKARLELGRDGTGKIMNGSSNISMSAYMDTKLKEENR